MGLKELRKEKRLTQRELGDKCDPPISRSHVSRIENDKGNYSMDALGSVAKALGGAVVADIITMEIVDGTEWLLRRYKVK